MPYFIKRDGYYAHFCKLKIRIQKFYLSGSDPELNQYLELMGKVVDLDPAKRSCCLRILSTAEYWIKGREIDY
jgi:hypothetical protein